MSSGPQTAPAAPPAAAAPAAWPALDLLERRVLGVLVEKQKTSKSADAYPMSVNALTTGANQKSNRDPVLSLSDEEVEDALARCQKKGLAIKITGGRVVRWRHALYEAWLVHKVDLAVLAELLLRGPQTEGELRTRASRMEDIDDLDKLRTVLRPLVERRLVVYLTPEDRRGAVLTHGFHDPQELKQLRARHAAEPLPLRASAPADYSPPPPAAPAPSLPQAPRADETVSALEDGLAQARQEVADLKQLVAGLQSAVDGLREELRQLKQSLGA
jgi:uncharacterized protein YceH (UPF0502 family)